jgi:hypothetical protein
MAGQVVEPWQLWREVWAWGGPDVISRNKVGACLVNVLLGPWQQFWWAADVLLGLDRDVIVCKHTVWEEPAGVGCVVVRQLWHEVWAWGGPDVTSRNKVSAVTA